MTQHHRDAEDDSYEHSRDRDIPQWLYWLMTFINRLGFPVAVCIYLFYSQNTTIKELRNSMELIAKTMSTMTGAVDRNTTAIDELKRALRRRISD